MNPPGRPGSESGSTFTSGSSLSSESSSTDSEGVDLSRFDDTSSSEASSSEAHPNEATLGNVSSSDTSSSDASSSAVSSSEASSSQASSRGAPSNAANFGDASSSEAFSSGDPSSESSSSRIPSRRAPSDKATFGYALSTTSSEASFSEGPSRRARSDEATLGDESLSDASSSDESLPKKFLRTARSGCSVCGNLNIRRWGKARRVLVTTAEILTQSSIKCPKCRVILQGVSAHWDLEPDARLEFTYSQGGSFFALHRLEVSDDSDYDASDEEDFKIDSDKASNDDTEDEGTQGAHSHDGRIQNKERRRIGGRDDAQSRPEYLGDTEDSDPHETIEFYVEKGFPSPGRAVGPARTLPAEFTIQDATLISEWLEDCEENHGACKQPTPNLPTRVLFVGSDDRLPHLYESRIEEARYTALSHCWGAEEHRPPTTTSTTLARRKKGIDWAELPPTFTDAMAVTRMLGIDYIWIDSLCIIQDDPDDWAKESARMVYVYQEAVLTISADGALNSREGLFHTVSQRATTAQNKISWGPHEKVLYTRMTNIPAKSVRIHSMATSSMQNNPLRSRAWTLQEWLVSPRVVHFTKGELVWECRQVHRCECQVAVKKSSSMWSSKTKSHFIEFPEWSNRVWVNWHLVVNEFSKRLITHDADRLPALSGIAALTKPDASGDYLAGIWESELPSSLLWMAESGKGSIRRREYYAPTWSWASISGPEIRLETVDTPLAKVLSVSKELASANPFGPLKSASITIKAPVARFPSHVEWQGKARTFFSDRPNGYSGILTLDVTTPFEMTTVDELVIAMIGYSREEPGDSCEDAEGLALKPLSEFESCFRRVGRVELEFDDTKHWRRVLSNVLKARNKTISIV